MSDKNFDFDVDIEETHAFIQWKNTHVCFDFYCDCGAHCHFDGYFAYCVNCPHCNTDWVMPSHLFPRRKSAADRDHESQLLEPDEDYSDEFVDAEGVTRLKARPVK